MTHLHQLSDHSAEALVGGRGLTLNILSPTTNISGGTNSNFNSGFSLLNLFNDLRLSKTFA
jgi:hypothetical protein